jgi:hypothetical protein
MITRIIRHRTAIIKQINRKIHCSGSPIDEIRRRPHGERKDATNNTENHLDGAGNSAAIVPIEGVSLIFAMLSPPLAALCGWSVHLMKGRPFVTLSDDSLADQSQSNCQRVE